KYKIVRIGCQTWMAQNLDYHGEDGYIGLCYGDKEKKRNAKVCSRTHGRLYDWDEAKKACPRGWRLPSDAEWQRLIDFAGGKEVAGNKLKASEGWKIDRFYCNGDKYMTVEIDNQGGIKYREHNNCPSGTDELGFAALPAGGGDRSDGSFSSIEYSGGWWSATEYYVDNFAYHWYMGYDHSDVIRYARDKALSASVRCVLDGR
ncbi:MAG: hypothetical protein FWH22_08565, partial [Fibromonadales bacterium]|nr:hypothetical protein [Fibromonadales bacterium]